MEGLDLLLENNYGPEGKFQQAAEADEGFALAHGYAAYMWMLRAQSNGGQHERARANLGAATQAWRGADSASPEFNALSRLAQKAG